MIVVTGAAGFIGSNVVAALNDRGFCDLLLCDWLGKDHRWRNLQKRIFLDWVFPEQLMASLDHRSDIEGVIHLGAITSTMSSDGDEIIRSNFQFSLRLLDWCARNAVPLVYASSAATYGDGAQGFEDGLVLHRLRALRPLNLYGWSKHQFDLVVAQRVAKQLPLPPKCIGLKFFNVFGPNEYHKADMMSVVAKNYTRAAAGAEIRLFKSDRNDYEDGGQKRDFVYVDDVAEVILWCLASGPTRGLFNVGTGNATTFRELIEALYAAVGQSPAITYVPMPEELRGRYQYFTEASMTALQQAGYKRPFTPYAAAVSAYVEYLSASDPHR